MSCIPPNYRGFIAEPLELNFQPRFDVAELPLWVPAAEKITFVTQILSFPFQPC